jgi:NAD(P)-dependent dehydrogenase (short-subunit alcohol dehydrogenase family)
VNLFGVVHGIQAFLPRMLERGEQGHVVNVASMAGVVGGGGVQANRITVGDGKAGFGAMYGYMATKTAIVGLTESLAGDLSGTPIGLSVLCPSHHDATHIFENSRVHRPESAGGPMSDAEYQAVDGNTNAKRKETFGQTRLDRTPSARAWCARSGRGTSTCSRTPRRGSRSSTASRTCSPASTTPPTSPAEHADTRA